MCCTSSTVAARRSNVSIRSSSVVVASRRSNQSPGATETRSVFHIDLRLRNCRASGLQSFLACRILASVQQPVGRSFSEPSQSLIQCRDGTWSVTVSCRPIDYAAFVAQLVHSLPPTSAALNRVRAKN
jgi:hypothetical protein